MKKRASFNRLPLRENINGGGTGVQREQVKKHNIQLPKLQLSSVRDNVAKKTLLMGISKIEEYTQQCQYSVPKKIWECLNTLKTQAQQGFHSINSNTIKTEPNENKSLPIFEKGISQSQVFNINRHQLKKVKSRDLFEKVTTVKYQTGALTNVSQQEIIIVLKKKIEQKDKTIRKLHSHLDQLNGQINLLKEKVETANQQKSTFEKEKINFEEKKHQIVQRNNQLTQTVQTLKQSEKQREIQAVTFKQRIKTLQQKLKQRENEITALWQINLGQK